MSFGIAWQDIHSSQVKWWTGTKRTVRLRGLWIGYSFIGWARGVKEDAPQTTGADGMGET